jgi:hypothetical protein
VLWTEGPHDLYRPSVIVRKPEKCSGMSKPHSMPSHLVAVIRYSIASISKTGEELKMIWKEIAVACYRLCLRDLPLGTEETLKVIIRIFDVLADIRSQCLQNMSEVLPLEQPVPS